MRAVGAGNGDGELDVAADVGTDIVDDADDEQTLVPQTEGIDFVAGISLRALSALMEKAAKRAGELRQ